MKMKMKMKRSVRIIATVLVYVLITMTFLTRHVNADTNSKAELVKVNGIWYYMENGEVKSDYTGLANNENGTWYVEKGIAKLSKTGLVKVDGTWFYIIKGKVQSNYTGLAKNSNGIWYVQKGVVSLTAKGLYKVNDVWYYVLGSKVQSSYTGLATNSSGTWYVEDGIVSLKYNGTVTLNGNTYTVSGSKVVSDVNTYELKKIDGTWYYTVNGVAKTDYTGLAENSSGMWYVKNGVISLKASGLYKIDGKWYYLAGSKVQSSYTGLATNSSGTWYVENGIVSLSYSGEVIVDNTIYTIENSKVTSTAPVEEESNTIDMSLIFTKGDSWGTGMVYNIAVQNNESESVKNWVATITVPSGTVLNNYWNCECSLSGTTLTVRGVYVNDKYDTSIVPANGKVEGLGISINTWDSEPIGDYIITVGDSTSTGSGTGSDNGEGGGNGSYEPEEPEDPVEAETGSSVANHGALKVSGTQLVDKNGEPYRLCGVSTHGLAWFPQYVNKDTFQYFRDDWGANVIRLAMYTDEYGGYLNGGSQEQLETYIDNGVKYATELGMYVIIDWHILATNPSNYTEQAKAFFTKMASKYANYDNVLYEICNEPTGSDWNTVIKPYAEKVIETIRQYDEDAVVLVGTNTWSQDVDAVVGNKIEDDNVMYVAHFYAATHGESYRNKVVTAIEGGVPVFISECSVCEASGNGGVGEESADAWFRMLRENNISYVAWNISNKSESSALISSSCNKLSCFLESELSVTGKWFRTRIRKDRGLN